MCLLTTRISFGSYEEKLFLVHAKLVCCTRSIHFVVSDNYNIPAASPLHLRGYVAHSRISACQNPHRTLIIRISRIYFTSQLSRVDCHTRPGSYLGHTNYINSLASAPACCLIAPLQLGFGPSFRRRGIKL